MKLAVLGVVTAGLGVAFTVPGLIGIGLFWVVMGLVARGYRNRLEEPTGPGAEEGTAADRARSRLATDGRTFTLSTLLWLAIGIPSVAVGVFEIGIGADDAGWRWLPIAVGGFALVIGVLGGLLYGAGSAVTAATGVPDKDATVWIRKVRETGTFVNERPRLEFTLHVEPDAATGVAAYSATKKATVPFTAMGSLRVGDGFRARVVGPEKPTSMEIHWDQPVSGGAAAGAGEGATATAPVDVSTRLEELEQLRREAKITDEEYTAQRERILGSL
jgi:hypothetical protein